MKRLQVLFALGFLLFLCTVAVDPLAVVAGCQVTQLVNYTHGTGECQSPDGCVFEGSTYDGGYYQCVAGSPGKCNCVKTCDVTIYKYKCDTDWNINAIVQCAIEAGFTAGDCFVCATTGNPTACISCIAGILDWDECTSVEDFCDYIDSCDTVSDGSFQHPSYHVEGNDC